MRSAPERRLHAREVPMSRHRDPTQELPLRERIMCGITLVLVALLAVGSVVFL